MKIWRKFKSKLNLIIIEFIRKDLLNLILNYANVRDKLIEPELLEIIHDSFLIGGKEKTINHLFEEMGELQTAICQNNRGRNTNKDVTTEMADVLLLITKSELIYGSCGNDIIFKITRLQERLKKAKEKIELDKK